MANKNNTLEQITNRYTEESKNSCNLSCGNNIDYLQIKKGERILDLGCGKGNETIKAALLTDLTGLAVGVDITEDMLKKASQNASFHNISNVQFVLADIENLPFQSDSFDAIISNCAINHASDKQGVYKEMFRVLKKGGRFVVSDAATKVPLPEEIKNSPEAVAQCFGGAITEKEYMQCIESSCFTNINVLKRREYKKNGYDFISLTIQAFKPL